MAAPTQIGQAWELGFQGAEYTGFAAEDLETKTDATEEIVPDENNATTTVITYDAKSLLSGTFLIKDGSSIAAPAKNSIISMKGPGDSAAVKRRVQEASIKFSRGIARLSLTLIRETSMGTAYDAIS
jgi:hypothetical protein